MRHPSIVLFVAASCLLATASSFGSKFNRVVEVGGAAPKWSNLIGVDGQRHSLSDYDKAKAIVVVFTCNHCPVAKAYEDRLKQIVTQYKKKKVQLIAISVSNRVEDRLDKMKIHAKKNKFNFPYLYDPTQKSAWSLGATATPHVFLLDEKRKIAYMGAIDNNMIASKVEYNYLRDAIDAVVAGKKPEVTETRQFGCGIQYEPVTVKTVSPAVYEKTIKKHRGKVVLVDFWATWCIPCRKRFHHTVEMSHEFGGKGFAAVSLSLDDGESKERVLKFLTRERATFDNLMCQFGGEDKSFEVYNIEGGALPHYKLYDRTGKLRATFAIDVTADKQFTAEDVEKKVRELLKEKPPKKR